MFSKRVLTLFIFFFIRTYASFSQDTIPLSHFYKIVFDSKPNFISSSFLKNLTSKDSLVTIKNIQSVVNECNKNSYFSVKYFTEKRCDTTIYRFDVGEKLYLGALDWGNLPLMYHKSAKSSFTSSSKLGFNHSAYYQLCKKVTKEAENSGYPFASIQIDSLKINNLKVYGKINYQSGPLILFDTLFVISNLNKTKRKFLENYLRIKKGQPYDERKVRNIKKQLATLPYLKADEPFVFFGDKYALVELKINEKKSNFADGIIGFLPNHGNSSKLLFTGEFNMNLNNLFNSGKAFKVEWKSFQKASQTLNLDYYHPNLFSSVFDISANFKFFKQDSTFFTMNKSMNIGYRFPNGFKFSYKAAMLSSRVGQLANYNLITSLPPFADYNMFTNGFVVEYFNLDDMFSTRKGSKLFAEFQAGNKTITKNPNFPETFYQNVKLTAPQYKITFAYDYFFSIKKSSTLNSKIAAGSVRSNNLMQNDMFRLGGLKSLRGFNENFFYASDFVFSGLEFRQYFEQSSYLLVFLEKSYLYYNLPINNYFEDQPFAMGGGISFAAAGGMFNFTYALGKSKIQDFSLNQSKIHFGYVSKF